MNRRDINDMQRYLKRAMQELPFTPSIRFEECGSSVKFFVSYAVTDSEGMRAFLNLQEILAGSGFEWVDSGEVVRTNASYKGRFDILVNWQSKFDGKMPVVEIW